jgi:hypothetical protein
MRRLAGLVARRGSGNSSNRREALKDTTAMSHPRGMKPPPPLTITTLEDERLARRAIFIGISTAVFQAKRHYRDSHPFVKTPADKIPGL